MEWNGMDGRGPSSPLSLSLSSRSALRSADDRLVGPPSLWRRRRRASLWNGATGRTEGGRGRRQRRGGRKEERRSESRRGPLSLPPSEESNRGAERRGKSKPTKLLLLPSRLSSLLLSSTLLTSPPHAPLSPPLPCGASFVLPPFLPANYIIYAAIHGMKEIHSRRRISKLRGVETGPPLTRREIFPGSHTRARASRRGDGWMPKEPFSSMTDRPSAPVRSFPGSFAAVPPAPVPH